MWGWKQRSIALYFIFFPFPTCGLKAPFPSLLSCMLWSRQWVKKDPLADKNYYLKCNYPSEHHKITEDHLRDPHDPELACKCNLCSLGLSRPGTHGSQRLSSKSLLEESSTAGLLAEYQSGSTRENSSKPFLLSLPGPEIHPEYKTHPVSRKLQPKTTLRYKRCGCSTFDSYGDGQNSNSILCNRGMLKEIYYLLESRVLLSICLITGFQWLGAHRPFALNFTLIFMAMYCLSTPTALWPPWCGMKSSSWQQCNGWLGPAPKVGVYQVITRGVRKCALLCLHIKTTLSLEIAKTCHFMSSQCLLLQTHFSFFLFPSRGAFPSPWFAGRRPVPVFHHSQPKEKGAHVQVLSQMLAELRFFSSWQT